MTDLRESVARAIATSYGLDPDDIAPRSVICGPGNEHLQEWEAYEEQASAALRAVADAGPTDAMIEAAARELFIQDAREYADESDDVAEWWDTTDTWAKWIAIARAAVAAAMKEMGAG